MGFESYRQGAFTKRLADLPDQPNMQAAELKTYFDSSPEELRQALNRLCDTFQVCIIPYTYEHTNFHSLKPGSVVNLEFDIIGKYLSRMTDLLNE